MGNILSSSLGNSQIKNYSINDSEVIIENHPQVASPNYYSDMFLDVVKNENMSNNQILDFGCGSGFLSALIFKNNYNTKIDLIDINSESIRISEKNLTKNGIKENYNLINDDGFNIHYEKLYDKIFANLPQLPSNQLDKTGAIYGGLDGFDLIRKMLKLAPNLLKPNGSLYMVMGDFLDRRVLQELCKKYCLDAKLKSSKVSYPGIATIGNKDHIESLGYYKFDKINGKLIVKLELLEFKKRCG